MAGKRKNKSQEVSLSDEDFKQLGSILDGSMDPAKEEVLMEKAAGGSLSDQDLGAEDFDSIPFNVDGFKQEGWQKANPTTEDYRRQLLQGPAMGGLHNIEGALAAGGQMVDELVQDPTTITGEDRGASALGRVGEAFTDARSKGIKRNELARHRLGAAKSMGLELLGGAVVGGALPKVFKTGAKFLGKEMLENVVTEFGEEGAKKILRNAGKLAKSQAKYGAATGAMASEGESLSDVGTDALLGAGVSAALPLVGPAARGVGKTSARATAYVDEVTDQVKALKKLKKYGVDQTVALKQVPGKVGRSVASLLSSLSDIPEDTLMRGWKNGPDYVKKWLAERGVKASDFGKEGTDSYAVALEATKVLRGNIGKYKDKARNDLTNIIQTSFGDQPVPDSLRQKLLARFSAARADLPQGSSGDAIRNRMHDYEKILSPDKGKIVGRNPITGKPRYENERPIKLKDLYQLYSDMKDDYANPGKLLGGPQSRSALQDRVNRILYGGKGSKGITVRNALSQIDSEIDKPLKRYEDLYNAYDGINKRIETEGGSRNAWKQASNQSLSTGISTRRLDELMPVTPGQYGPRAPNSLNELANMVKDADYLNNPELSAFTTGRSLFVPLVAGMAGNAFGPSAGKWAGLAGAAVASPYLIGKGITGSRFAKRGARELRDRLQSGVEGPVTESYITRETTDLLRERLFGEDE